ncbi:MAG: NAD(P)-dependent oxidoreductase [Candidatus Saccharimonadales bacterium]
MSTILLATQKPFSSEAVQQIKEVVELAGHTFSLLENYSSAAELQAAVRDVEGLIVRSDQVDAALLDHAQQLKIVVRAGAGYDNLDLPGCTAHRVVAMNTPGQNSNAVAELAIGLMVYAARNFYQPGTGSELRGKTLGLQAYGNVGRLVAKHAKGMGMNVSAFDPFVDSKRIEADDVTPLTTLESLYKTCDYVSLHIPALPDTLGSINYNLLSLLPKGATVINTARKEIVNEQDLARVLQKRPDVRYVADVMPDNYSQLIRQFPAQVYATPKKMGAETAEANTAAGVAAAKQIVNFLKNGDTTFQLNR